MAIDIFNIKPSVISRDLKGKYVLIYGKEKSGKTTAAASFPKALLCAFERGYNGLGGVMAADISSWSDFKTVLRQLEKPEAKQMYKTVAIDTMAEAYSLCEDYICSQNGVQKIGDIPYGAGYAACKREFEKCLRKITLMDYGLVIIAHAQIKNEEIKNVKGKDEVVTVEKISPAIPARAADVVNRLVDVTGFIKTSWLPNGQSERTLITRATPTIMAGTRLKYLPSEIPFGYDNLVQAISDAIQKEADEGAVVVDKKKVETDAELTFDMIRTEAAELWKNLVTEDKSNAQTIMKIVKEVFGREMKLSEINESQKDLFYLVLTEMRALATDNSN